MEKRVQIKLSEPLVTMGGLTISELTADFSKIKTRDLALINRVARRLKGSDGTDLEISLNKAADSEFRCACTWVAVLRGTQGISLDDIDSLALADALSLGEYSLPFLVKV